MILLTSKKCAPCKMVKRFFEERKIPYVEIDIESEEGMYFAKKFKINMVPAIISEGKVAMIGFNQEKLKELVGLSEKDKD